MPRRESVSIAGPDGRTLAAVLDLPEPNTEDSTDRSVRAPALLAHCFTCGKDLRAASVIARTLAEAGVPTLRVDFTGLGSSEGEFGREGLSGDVADLLAGSEWLRERFGRGPALLIGHSLGGAAAIVAAGSLPGVTAVVTIAAPAEPSHVKKYIVGHERVHEQGAAQVEIGGRRFFVHRALLDDLAEHDRLPELVNSLRRPLLILHAPEDQTVPLAAAGRLYESARHPKSFVALDGADHLLSRIADARRAAHIILAWAEPYLAAQ